VTDEQEHHYHPIGDPLGQEADALVNPEVAVEVPPPEQMSLIRRLRQPRTILSIAVPLAIIVIALYLNRSSLSEVPGYIGGADPLFLVAAFAIYYVGFPLRGHRWATLLKGAGYRVSTKDATEILFLSWLVNCIVPAKLGDVYRAYLLKLNSPVSATRTLGTVFIERILDLFAISILGLAAGYIRFRDNLGHLPLAVQVIFAMGAILVVLMAVGLVVLRNFGRRLMNSLPVPGRAVELYERFEEGVFNAVGLRGLPWLGLLTVLIWGTEALRLYFVILALGFGDLHLGLSGVLFVALIGSLLTAVPLTPAGLGAVEGGVGAVLVGIFGVAGAQATAILLVDRTISVFSIVVLGSIAYVISSKPRGGGMKVEETAPAGVPAV
jgi:glycosyltransferase 2 family protein